MRKRFKKPIGVKIFKYYAAVVIPFIVICLFTVSWYSKNIIQKEYRHNIEQITQSAHESVLLMVKDVENVLATIQTNKQIQNVLGGTDFCRSHMNIMPEEEIDELKQAMLSIDVHNYKISQITLYVLQRYNYPTDDNNGVIRSDTAVKNAIWYQNVLKSPDKTRWDVYYNDLNRNSYIMVSKAILNATNCQPIAVVRAKILVSDFTERIDKLTIGKTGKVFLTTESSIINTQQNKYISELKNNTAYFRKIKEKQPFVIGVRLGNIKSWIYSIPIGRGNINITSMIPEKEIQSSARVIAKFVTVMIAIAILLICIVLYSVSKFISKPIRILAKNIGSYDLRSNKAIEPITDDEVGTVAKAFNTLISTLHNLIDDITTLHEQQQMARFKLLQAQINPHFLYNTLNAISCMARRYKATDIEEVVLALSHFFKHSLNDGKEYTTIKNEIEHVKSYFVIQNMRFKGKYKMTVDINPDIMDNKILKLTLQPLVENCIIHAFKDIDYVGVIHITGYRENGKIYLKVYDNGYGTNVEELNKAINNSEQSNKYGTTNVNQRIKLYFGQEYGLKYFENDEGGLIAVVCIGDERI
ncbi:MAG: histidine kinase [Firmicutes bacterium]|nr:histidine kinase [Bacillota bacterium]